MLIKSYKCRVIIQWLFFFAALFTTYFFSASVRYPVSPVMGNGINESSNKASILPINPSTFTIGTFNIRRGKGTDNIRDLNRVSDLIKRSCVDILGLNEVGGNWNLLPYGRGNSQVDYLAEKTDLNGLFMPVQYRWHFPYFGNGFLTRLEVSKWNIQPLVSAQYNSISKVRIAPEFKTQRNLSTFYLNIDNQEIVVLVTHLSKELIQDEQIREVFDVFQCHNYAILMGDFNLSRSHPILKKLLADFKYIDAIHTVLGEKDQRNRIDWILTTANFRVLDGGMYPVGVSDHPFFWIKLMVNAEFKQ